jgi:hypothetical protein
MTGFDIIELLRVENVLPVMGEECRNGGNDAGPVGAGQGQHELMMGHEAACRILEANGARFCGPALSPAMPLRQSRSNHQDEQTTGDPR